MRFAFEAGGLCLNAERFKLLQRGCEFLNVLEERAPLLPLERAAGKEER